MEWRHTGDELATKIVSPVNRLLLDLDRVLGLQVQSDRQLADVQQSRDSSTAITPLAPPPGQAHIEVETMVPMPPPAQIPTADPSPQRAAPKPVAAPFETPPQTHETPSPPLRVRRIRAVPHEPPEPDRSHGQPQSMPRAESDAEAVPISRPAGPGNYPPGAVQSATSSEPRAAQRAAATQEAVSVPSAPLHPEAPPVMASSHPSVASRAAPEGTPPTTRFDARMVRVRRGLPLQVIEPDRRLHPPYVPAPQLTTHQADQQQRSQASPWPSPVRRDRSEPRQDAGSHRTGIATAPREVQRVAEHMGSGLEAVIAQTGQLRQPPAPHHAAPRQAAPV